MTGPDQARPPGRPARLIPAPALMALAAVVGCVGEIYGIAGGAFLAPVLIGSGRKPSEVAPATLASTLVTSVAGVMTFVLLSLTITQPRDIALYARVFGLLQQSALYGREARHLIGRALRDLTVQSD